MRREGFGIPCKKKENIVHVKEITRLEAEKRQLTDILALHEPTCVKRPRLSEEDDNFRVPAVPPPRGGGGGSSAAPTVPPPRLGRQDSFLQTLEMLGSMEDLSGQYSNVAAGDVGGGGGTGAAASTAAQPFLDNNQDQLDTPKIEQDEFREFRFPKVKSSTTNYFLASKPPSLSVGSNGFQTDHHQRCTLAL